MSERRCGTCGKFSRDLYPVWAFRPNPEIDYDECKACHERREGVR
ncbi:hypothetical protein I5J50_gp62 [Mycobacterium phage Purky]|uniref:Uncharacterized protein n=1 Tax=Mycobacterium phage Purky TaxID=2593351 RepID=A0A514TWW6_9CAUD|nr:hypothetical protein I5J50_gp62 [Mycobacterium phage Purky]QDK01190.1 hypothetical protein SEA_PURKY_62 [Mycobacterium phage Purky]